MNSLRVRLLLIIGASLVALWGAVAAWMLTELRGELRSAMDGRLAASARMVAALAAQFPADALQQGAAAAPMLDVVARDGLACEVSQLRGEVSVVKVARTAASPVMDDAAPGYSTRMFGGKLWRTYVLQQGDLRIATADRIELREAILRDVGLTVAVPFAVAVIGSLLAVWVGIGRGLAPVERLRAVLAARRPDDDTPLPETPVPRELRPLVDALGHLLERVRGAITRERQFTDDAAHELRTPLTAVKTHLQVLDLSLPAQPDGGTVGAALSHAHHGVQRMQRTLEQLLLLARLDGPDEADAHGSAACLDAARQAAGEVEASRQAAGRIVLAPGIHPLRARVPDALLVSALRNLLDNAVSAAPPGSPIELRIGPGAPGRVRFEVLDRGPGLSEAECAMATRRFWRRGGGAGGSGLGLAIVQAIAARHGGAVQLAPREGGGLRAELELPAA